MRIDRARRLAPWLVLPLIAAVAGGCGPSRSVSTSAFAPPGPGTGKSTFSRSSGRSEGRASLLKAGAAAERAGNMAVATKAYANASRGRGGTRARLALGRVLLKDNKPREAQDAFEAVLRSSPRTVAARVGLGQSQLAQGSYEVALTSFAQALKTKVGPRDGRRALLGSGISLDGLGRHEEAQGRYRQVLQTDPADAAALNNLGLSLAISGRSDEAITVLKRVAGRSRATARSRQNLALAYALAGREDAARRVASVDMKSRDVEANLRAIRKVRK